MGSQVLRPAVFPDVFKKHLKKGALKGVEHLERLVNGVLVRTRHLFAAYLNRDVHFT